MVTAHLYVQNTRITLTPPAASTCGQPQEMGETGGVPATPKCHSGVFAKYRKVNLQIPKLGILDSQKQNQNKNRVVPDYVYNGDRPGSGERIIAGAHTDLGGTKPVPKAIRLQPPVGTGRRREVRLAYQPGSGMYECS